MLFLIHVAHALLRAEPALVPALVPEQSSCAANIAGHMLFLIQDVDLRRHAETRQ